MSIVHASRLRAAGALLLAALCAPAAHAANGTLIYSVDSGLGDGVASDGDAGSTNLPGIEIQVRNISDAGGTPLPAIHYRDDGWFFTSYRALTYDDGTNNPWKGMSIRSADGSEFRLGSFSYLNWGEGFPGMAQVVGYRNGSQVATQSFDPYDAGFNPKTITLNSGFNDVDDVRLVMLSAGAMGTFESWHSINDIVIADAVPAAQAPTDIALSASTVNQSAPLNATVGTLSTTDANAGDTHTYTLVSGAGDADNASFNISGTTLRATTPSALAQGSRSVRLRTTDQGGLSHEEAFTITVVDDVAPTVTAGNIAISGATGTAGAYRIGDTVTATWNDTAGGDNNADTITGVTVDFSQFGGGVAVAASNSADTWTASYTLVAGGIEAGSRYVAVRATDDASNATTRNGNPTATVDTVAPAATQVVLAAVTPASATSVDWIADFNNTVSNVSVDDFQLTATGSATGTLSAVSSPAGSSITVSVTDITGDGSLRVDLRAATDITDASGNAGPAARTGAVHTVAIPTAPDAPGIGAATPADGEVSVAFTAPADDGGSAVTGYTVTASPGGAVGTGAASPIVVQGLTNGTPYTFTVTATNAIGTSLPSGASAAATPKGAQLITFASPGARDFGTAPTLSATASSGLAVTFSSTTTGVCTITSGGTLSFVTAGTCTIAADQAGDAVWSAATRVSQTFTVNAVAPGAPTIGTASPANTSASVGFTAPASTGGVALSSYTVTASPGGATGTGASAPITVSGLTNGVAYTFTVTATNAAALTGPASAASNAVTPASPQTITFNPPGTQVFGTAPTLGASASSGLAVTFASTTSSVCTITSGGTLTFLTAGTCSIVASQAGDASWQPAATVTRTFAVTAVAPGAPSNVVANPGDTQASVSFSPPGNTGGSSVLGYIVTVSPADVVPVAGAASPIVITGLTNGVAYTFTVEAETVAGVGPPSSPSAPVTPRALQTVVFANPGPQPFGTSPTLVATSDAGLAVQFSSNTPAVCTVTPGGLLTLVSLGQCSINADQPGDAAWLPAPQTTNVFDVVAAPPGAPTAVVATAGAGQASVAFLAPAFTGGVAITGYTVTASPGGASASGAASPIVVPGLVDGTPYTFTVRATNAVGQGPASTASTAVTPNTPLQVANVALAVGYGAGATPATLAISGAPAATSAEVVSPPAHGTAVATGAGITYQPAAGYAGPDSFTYRASNGLSTSGVATVSVTIGAPSIAVDTASLPDGALGVAYAQALGASGGAAPYAWTLDAGALPSGVTLAANGQLAGMPAQAGSFAFTVRATDASTGTGPFSATRALTLQVGQGAQAISAFIATPAAPSFSAGGTFALSATGGASGQPVVFASLTPATCSVSGATATTLAAGPCRISANQAGDANYTAAPQQVLEVAIGVGTPTLAWPATIAKVLGDAAFDLVDPTSPSPGAFTFASADPAVATVSGRTVTVVGTGTTTLTATQAATGNYAGASVTLSLVVDDLPDPTTDGEVVAGLQAQVDAAMRLAEVQSGNIHDRLRQLRAGANGSSNGLRLAYQGDARQPGASVPMGGRGAVPSLPEGWGVWAAGTLRVGERGPDGFVRGMDLSSDGLTIGLDRALSDRVLVGLALGAGGSDSEAQDSASRVDARQRTLAVYGLWRAGEHLFIDGLLASGRLDYDLRRYSAQADAVGLGQRDGDQRFGALTVGWEQGGERARYTGYGRLDLHRGTLDAYAETGLGMYGLEVGEQDLEHRALALGLEGRHQLGGEAGGARWSPFWRVEYSEAIDGGSDVLLRYAGRAQDYALSLDRYGDHALGLGVGVDVAFGRGWTFSLLFDHRRAAGDLRESGIGLRIGYGGQAAAPGQAVIDDEAVREEACRRGAACRRRVGPPNARP